MSEFINDYLLNPQAWAHFALLFVSFYWCEYNAKRKGYAKAFAELEYQERLHKMRMDLVEAIAKNANKDKQ